MASVRDKAPASRYAKCRLAGLICILSLSATDSESEQPGGDGERRSYMAVEWRSLSAGD
ncbi:MAG: hypothetical protein NTW87_05825 [Planctomycetota bacterium]|nr:hypothetical protein [Planctomycetota bacterium]